MLNLVRYFIIFFKVYIIAFLCTVNFLIFVLFIRDHTKDVPVCLSCCRNYRAGGPLNEVLIKWGYREGITLNESSWDPHS